MTETKASAAEAPPSRLRRWGLRLVTVGLSLAVLFLIFEVGFRTWEKVAAPSETWAIADDDLNYRTRPNHEGTNAHGLYDDPIGPKSSYRILMLGDSIAFYGDDVADTWVGRLETRLNDDDSLAPTDVINAGIKGYTNYQEVVWLEKYGLPLEPDLVGVGFCLNDVHRFAHRFEFDENGEVIGQGYQFTEEAVESVQSPLYALARKSRFLVWLRRRLSVFDSIVEMATSGGYTFDYRPDFNTAWKDEGWPEIEKQLRRMKTLADGHGFRTFVVVFPFGEQLRQDYLEADYNYVTKPQQKLSEICQRLGIPYLDLFEEFDRDLHLIEDQIHLTAEGRELAARRTAEFLKERELAPPSTGSPTE